MDRQNRPHALVLALAIATACVGGVGATTIEQGGGAPLGVARAVHVSHASTDARVDAAREPDQGATAVLANGGGGIVINATFDTSITSDPNAAVIEAMISDAIGIYESLLTDPITVSIRFRYSTTYADGTTPLPAVDLAVSESGVYVLPWNT